jgi:hypothetical protein
MLVDLCVHAVLPGQFERFRPLWAGAVQPIVSERGGRLLFTAFGDSGALGEVVDAWAFESLVHYAEHRQLLAADPAWAAASRDAGRLLRHRVRQLIETTGFSTVAPPPPQARLIDLRCYSFKPEAMHDFLPVCEAAGLPRQREHCGALVFHGVSLSGRCDQLVQAWAYPDHERYERGQRALFADAAWSRSYRERVIHLVDRQEHRLLKPLAKPPAAGDLGDAAPSG